MAEGASVGSVLEAARLFEPIPAQAWQAIRAEFRDGDFDLWSDAAGELARAGLGAGAILAYGHASPQIARDAGVVAAVSLVPFVLRLAKTAGLRAATDLIHAAPIASRRLRDGAELAGFYAVADELGRSAPESVSAVLGRIDHILSALDVDGLRRWVLTGLRLSGDDVRRRHAYFALDEGESLRSFDRETGLVTFAEIDRRLALMLGCLWGIWPMLRPSLRRTAVQPARRTTFDSMMVRLPETFPGFSREEAERVFKAAVAHVGAHLMFSERFQLRSLKPLQVALISLIEDARVEHLAMRANPGLAGLWLPFHIAQADGLQLALPLMARLSRALIDPDFEDDDPWVRKGKTMFFDSRSDWTDQSISRSIGGLLGNDLGQMRVQFNPRTYVVQPAYRDDNLGIWDFGDRDGQPAEDDETIYQGARISQAEEPDQRHDRERLEPDDRDASRARQVRLVETEAGIPVATYAEWDYQLGRERHDWTTVKEYQPRRASTLAIDRIHHDYADVLARISKLVRSARVSQPVRIRRQAEGERLDLEAAIRAAIDRRAGITPEGRVYESSTLRNRDLSVLLLIDISESTRDAVSGSAASVFELEQAATALVAEAIDGAGDPFALHAFSSNGRADVRYVRIKDFADPYDEVAKGRLAGLEPGYSTRMGAALRHAGVDLERQRSHRRLLLIITDGEPSDVDVADKRYLLEDARRAVHDLGQRGIDVFCVALDSGGDDYLSRIFGRRNVLQIDRISALPEKLPILYFRLTH